MNDCNQPAMTDQEIGQILGLSRARVFQIRSKAMLKIREALLDDPEFLAVAFEMGYLTEREEV